MVQRGLFCAAAVVMICAIGATLLQLAVLILSFSSPVAITVIALAAVVLLNSARRRLRADRHRSGRFGRRKPVKAAESPGNPRGIRR